MQEIYEFRVQEQHASRLFAQDEGEKHGVTKLLGDKFVTVRTVKLYADDPKFKRVGELEALIKKEPHGFFFAGWNILRRYTADELEKAELFLLHHVATFEPSGENCGTQYDESSACRHCQAGARQTTPLFLDWKRIPKSKDIARTIAGEIVVSARLMKLFKQHSITGAKFLPIRHRPASSAESKDWFQFVADSSDALIIAPTKTGIHPFDEDLSDEYRCPLKDQIGLNRLSEVWISRASYNGSDIAASRQFLGRRGGLLRPERLLLISPKLRRAIEAEKLKGFKFEVAHLI